MTTRPTNPAFCPDIPALKCLRDKRCFQSPDFLPIQKATLTCFQDQRRISMVRSRSCFTSPGYHTAVMLSNLFFLFQHRA